MQENLITRLNLFLSKKGISPTVFADSCGIPRPSASQLLSGRNQKVSDAIISKIHSAYPDLNIVWLMFGEGVMENVQEDTSLANNPKIPVDENSGNEILTTYDQTEYKNANLKGLTQPQTDINLSINQQLEDNKKILELQLQIEKMRQNPRRVTQITVYYDDSTFETFIPSK